jgi:hypothetical protein
MPKSGIAKDLRQALREPSLKIGSNNFVAQIYTNFFSFCFIDAFP